jgi:hypothetical protein
MSNRIDNLETSIQELISSGIDAEPQPKRPESSQRGGGQERSGDSGENPSLLLVDQPHELNAAGAADGSA